MPSIHILLVNQPLNNRGDEAAHKALVRSILKYIPEAEVHVLFFYGQQESVDSFEVNSNRTQYINSNHKYSFKLGGFVRYGIKYPILWHIHPYAVSLIRQYRWADIVVCAPGGICMGGFMNWGHQDMLLVAKKLKKPLFYYGRSIGPFWDDPEEKKYFKQRSQEILKYCSYVSLRESESIRIAHELGVANVVETTDTAFLDAPEVTVPSEIKKEIGRSPYVVFVPNLLIWHYYYRGRATKEDVIAFWCKIVDVINEIKPECKIVMLPQTFNYGSYEGDDIHLFHDIQAARSDSRIIVVDDQYSSDVQQQIIRSAEAVFGARYHSVVFAINNNVPFIAFSYEHKIAGLLEELGLQNAMIDIKPLFGSTAFNNSVIDKFSEKLTEIHRNPNAQLQAKEKAKIAFNLFVKKVREAVR